MWTLSSCFLRWVQVLLIHSTILSIILFAKHLQYDIIAVYKYIAIEINCEILLILCAFYVEWSLGSRPVSGCQWRY